tara:strand:- start:116 stop:451 length:336 start_codon:yes stop_codon:yes gene_type:complete
MRKLLILLVFLYLPFAYSQESLKFIPYEIAGQWKSIEGEFVRIIRESGEFVRVLDEKIIAQGTLKVKDGNLYITRSDIDDKYIISYVARNDILVISKPRSMQAWLFYRVGY